MSLCMLIISGLIIHEHPLTLPINFNLFDRRRRILHATCIHSWPFFLTFSRYIFFLDQFFLLLEVQYSHTRGLINFSQL